MNVEPTLSNLSKRGSDDSLETSNPTLFSGVELDLSNARSLDLLKFLDTQCLSLNRHVVDVVVLEKLVAFGSDVHHSLDYFFLNEKRVEAEIRKLLWEVVVRDGNHTKLGNLAGGRLRWKG